MSSLAGKVAVVTGASRGIGRGIALHLAGMGAEIVATARTEEAAARTVEAIREAGGTASAHAVDVSLDEAVEAFARDMKDRHGTIAVLVNNAGITRDNLLLRMKQEDWDAVLGTNLAGVFRLSKALVPGMIRKKWGRVVNITSVVGSLGNPGQANYAASKAGIEGFTRSLAREVASRNVTVNCVAPGFIDTDMTRVLGDDARGALLQQVPMGRLGTPDDVAEAVGFLAGDGAAYVTGVTLHVNGGMYM